MRNHLILNKSANSGLLSFSLLLPVIVNKRSEHFFKAVGILSLFLLVSNSFSAAIGFGNKATGGAGGKEVTVSNASALKSAAESSGATIITIEGSINAGVVSVNSNKTIQGADANAKVSGNFVISGSKNIIFRNFTFSNSGGTGTGDGLEITNGSSDIWVDHCTIGQCKDGGIDIKRGSDMITISWCKFEYTSSSHNHNFVNLVGHSDGSTEDRGKLKVTFHHNWYSKNCIERQPRVRFGQVHVFNNYYTSDRTNYVIGVGKESQILLEASYFKDQGNQTWYDWNGGKIQWTDDNIFTGNTKMSTWAENSQVFKPPYSYTKDKAEDVPSIVSSGAGSWGKVVTTNIDHTISNINQSGTSFNIKLLRSNLNFQLHEASDVAITLYNSIGKKVAVAVNGHRSPGKYSINLESYGLSNGVYYADVRLNSMSQKVTMVKQ